MMKVKGSKSLLCASWIYFSACGALLTGCATHTAPPTLEKVNGQLRFSSPEQAVDALKKATGSSDMAELVQIFGPQGREILHTGDAVEDTDEVKAFAKALEQRIDLVPLPVPPDTTGKPQALVLMIGEQRWAFPIPLVKSQGSWHYDTLAGKEELISRRIGENELTVISLCREYALAQLEYLLRTYTEEKKLAAGRPQVNPVPVYAAKFVSSPGKRDGLYWEPVKGEPLSPMGPLVARATEEGYQLSTGKGSQPFYGYYFKILTSQGPSARGGALNYIKNGKMSEGFALVAYPAQWGESGIMTFIIGPDGVMYERDLGDKTGTLAPQITRFDPTPGWFPVR